MKHETKKRINKLLISLTALIFIGSACMKFFGPAESLEIATKLGITPSLYILIGVIEIVCVILFIFPRTEIVGSLLLIAYMGGAIATHLSHGVSIVEPIAVSALVWITVFIRFPVLSNKLLNET